MSNAQFRERVRASISNKNLQAALDNNTERRLRGRALAFESIPDWQQRRQRAHAVRADVIDHLDDYLDQFMKQNRENGVIVHRAKDAAEAIGIVSKIAHKTSARLIAKSKSMVTEEINLNHALEAENIRVVETDLGEYIVQLRKERPAHIITPAVHLRRNDVGQLFHEKLGIPYTEDIPTLTNTARQVLREVFLTADIGVSGVNFGIAETGGICVVSNEGNARMVATLPPVHIALMGMERIVPTLDDLSLMLSLLARSATGQKLSVYTQLLHKPLSNQTRHLIILDNGRTRLRNSQLKESLYCIRCGACLNACPVFRELGGHAYVGSDHSIAPYPGPIGSVVSPGLLGDNFVQLAQASSLCGACKDACPVDIDLPKMLMRVRAGESPSPTEKVKKSEGGAGLSFMAKLFLQIYGRVARSPRLFALSQKGAALGGFFLAPFSQWLRLPALTGWGYSKDLPRFAGKTFRERFRSTAAPTGDIGKVSGNSETEKTDASVAAPPNTVRAASGAVAPRDGIAPMPFQGNEIDLADQFTRELLALGGQVQEVSDATEEIIEFLKLHDVHKIHLEPNTLDESLLRKANIEFTHSPDPAILVGVTRAVCGLADTGSVLEADGEGSPLHASLLPEIHIAVLKKSDILPSLPDAIKLVKDKRAAVFITGPSRTADIEMTLTIGVHGPREVHVFIVQ
jgi:L-lactate dehydrogenase complex protein LldF